MKNEDGDSRGEEFGSSALAYLALKPILDWVGALAVFVVTIPLLLAALALVKLSSPGPVIYSQIRLGRGGKPFRIYKFRTMTHDCEAQTGPVWSLAGDPRVTRIGRWLRDTHLDELPQLWNVLRGDMSMVGPRPERPELAVRIERSLPEFRDRLRVRPGITGFAQVRLPSDSDLDTVKRKLACDLYYIRSVGPMLDGRIVVSTALQLIGAATTSLSRQLVPAFASSDSSSPGIGGLDLHQPHSEQSRRGTLEPVADLHMAA